MNDRRHQWITEAEKLWHSGQGLEAGRLIADHIADADQPTWACRVLEVCLRHSGVALDVFAPVLSLAVHPDEWHRAHHIFDDLRRLTLKYDRQQNLSPREALLHVHLYLAENTARVIYNASDPLDPFDEDSAWWVAECARQVVDRTGEAAVAKAVWEAMIAP